MWLHFNLWSLKPFLQIWILQNKNKKIKNEQLRGKKKRKKIDSALRQSVTGKKKSQNSGIGIHPQVNTLRSFDWQTNKEIIKIFDSLTHKRRTPYTPKKCSHKRNEREKNKISQTNGHNAHSYQTFSTSDMAMESQSHIHVYRVGRHGHRALLGWEVWHGTFNLFFTTSKVQNLGILNQSR